MYDDVCVFAIGFVISGGIGSSTCFVRNHQLAAKSLPLCTEFFALTQGDGVDDIKAKFLVDMCLTFLSPGVWKCQAEKCSKKLVQTKKNEKKTDLVQQCATSVMLVGQCWLYPSGEIMVKVFHV